MYHIYLNSSFFRSVDDVEQVGPLVVQTLKDNPDAWINIRDLHELEPLPKVALPLPLGDASLLNLTEPEIRALTPDEVEQYWNQGPIINGPVG